MAVDAIPLNDSPAITVRSERGLLTTGRWRRAEGDDLVVVADLPRAEKPSVLLGEALHGLEPLLRRAHASSTQQIDAEQSATEEPQPTLDDTPQEAPTQSDEASTTS